MVADSNSDFEISNPGTLSPVFAHSGISSCQSSVSDIEFSLSFILDRTSLDSPSLVIIPFSANQPMTSSSRASKLCSFMWVARKVFLKNREIESLSRNPPVAITERR